MTTVIAGLLELRHTLLVVDIEENCADDASFTPEQIKVIQFGAVWTTPAGQVIYDFNA